MCFETRKMTGNIEKERISQTFQPYFANGEKLDEAKKIFGNIDIRILDKQKIVSITLITYKTLYIKKKKPSRRPS